MSNEKKIVCKQTYTIETIYYDDGTAAINRNNDGYSVIEMLGLTTIIQDDLLALYKDAVKPTLPKEINRSSVNSPVLHKEDVSK